MRKELFLAALVGGLIAAVAPSAQSSKGIKPHPDVKIETVEANNETGRVTFRVTVQVRQYVAEVGLWTIGDTSLVPTRVSRLFLPATGKETVAFMLPFEVPMSDSACVSFYVIEKKDSLQKPAIRDNVTKDSAGNIQHHGQELVEQKDDVFPSGSRWFFRTPDTLVVTDTDPGHTTATDLHTTSETMNDLQGPGEQPLLYESSDDSIRHHESLRGCPIPLGWG